MKNLLFVRGAAGMSLVFPAVVNAFLLLILAQLEMVVLGNRSTLEAASLPGSVDLSFDAQAGPNGAPIVLAVQADGKILVGGSFSLVGSSARSCLARFNSNGTLDETFTTGVSRGSVATGSPHLDQTAVAAIVVQNDDTILIGGNFSEAGGRVHEQIARLRADGNVDPGFTTAVRGDEEVNVAFRIPPNILAIAAQPDGRILIGGQFTNVDSTVTTGLARLQSDGSVDGTFNGFSGVSADRTSPFGPFPAIRSIGVQLDGKILIAGQFDRVNDTVYPSVARLETDGRPDIGFHPPLLIGGQARALLIQPDQRILIAAPNQLLRLNTDGSQDSSFHPAAIGSTPYNDSVFGSFQALALQPDGKIIVAGWFTSVDNSLYNRLARLNADGSLDTTFDPGTGAAGMLTPGGDLTVINTVLLQPDGQLLLGGGFASFDGVARTNLARVFTTGPEVALPAFRFPPVDQTLSEGQTLLLQANARGLPPMQYQWRLDGVDLSVATNSTLHLANVQLTHAGIYTVDVRNSAGVVTSNPLKVAIDPVPIQPGAVDVTFNPQGLDSITVVGARPQSSGKILVNGSLFSEGLSQSILLRLTSNGQADSTFRQATGLSVFAVQPDDTILLGTLTNLVRLNANGENDDSFHSALDATASVRALALQPDGKILVGGNSLVRLEPNGDLDPSWANSALPVLPIRTISLVDTGEILVSQFGTFHTPDSLLKVSSNGMIDSAFRPAFGGTTVSIYTVAVQVDGKVLVGGQFTTVNGSSAVNLARLNRDGTLDNTLQAALGPFPPVLFCTVDRAGRVLIGQVTGVTRLTPTGAVDPSWTVSTGLVSSITELANDELLIAGQFAAVNSAPRAGVAKLLGSASAPFAIEHTLRLGTTMRFSIPTSPNRVYALESKATLGVGPWQPVQTIAGDGLAHVLVDKSASGGTSFYRARAQ